MGRFVDVGKGSNRRPAKVDQKTVLDNLQKLFGNKVKGGRFIQDPQTRKFISAAEYHAKYTKPIERTHFIQGDIEPYRSPIDETVISSRRQARNDHAKHGTRIYEGRKVEQQEADSHTQQAEAKFEQTISDGMEEVANDLKYQNIKPETHIKSEWIMNMGDDS